MRDNLGTLYASSQAGGAVINLCGVSRRIDCNGRDSPPVSELSCRAWDMADLPFLPTSLECCLHKAAAAGSPLFLCPNTLLPAPPHTLPWDSSTQPQCPK